MKVGSIVELVNDNWDICMKDAMLKKGVTFPVKNKCYTIRDIDDGGLLLEEIVNPPSVYKEGFYEPTFNADRFRELLPPITIELEIIILEAYLNDF